MTMLGAFGHTLPFFGNTLSTICYLMPYLYYLPDRCAMECGVPGQGGRYQGLLEAVESAHGAAWLRSAGAVLPSDELSACNYCCLAVNGWLEMLLGVAIPIWGIALIERRAWRRWQGQQMNAAAVSLAPMLLNACVFGLASAACLLLAEKGAAMWRNSP